MSPEQVKKILVVRNDNIGDVICTTPCFEAIKRQFPEAKVAVLVNRIAEQVVRGNPWLDEVYVYDKAKHGRYRNPLIAWWHQAKLLWRIRRERFDLAIGIRSTFSVPQGWLVYASGAPVRLGAAPDDKKRSYAFFYTIQVRDLDQNAHEVERALGVLRPLGIELETKNLYFSLSPVAQQQVGKERDSWNLRPGLPVAVVNYNSRMEENRWWAQEKYAALINQLQGSNEVEVVLTHDQADMAIAQRICSQLSVVPPCFSSPRLDHFAALIATGQVFVSLEGGPIHVAA